ncbi:MAG: PQQ-binding-like beta-propeller repeat protein, partial [Planctomycetota bacterium]|nr:PQQ-binding-like beta-propeller repeat protein [Planctomycetota bacterium]
MMNGGRSNGGAVFVPGRIVSITWAVLWLAVEIIPSTVRAGEGGPAETPAPAGGEESGARAPSFEEIYAGYRPSFVDWGWVAGGGKLPLSLQPHYFNMAYVNRDTRVDGLFKKAKELEERREWREAMRLYQEVIDKFQDDLWQIAEEGVFIPSPLYAHRRLLAMPKSELAYYRTMKDPEAKQLFLRAARYNSLPDYAEVVEKYMATSWGDDALFVLGSAALDEGVYELARHYLEELLNYYRYSDVNRLEILQKLADCYWNLGREDLYAAVKAGIGSMKLDPADRQRAEAYFRLIEGRSKPAAGALDQRRSPGCVSMNDYALFPRPKTALSSKSFVWKVPLPASRRDKISFMQPTVVGNRIIYRYKNTVLCRSLLTGEEKWRYAPAGHIDWFDREWRTSWCAENFEIYFYPDQDVLVHDGLVFTSIYKNGPSLVALDMLTGQFRWAAGSIAATCEADYNTRYLCTPTAGRNCVYAPFVYDEIAGNAHLFSEAGITCFDSRTGKIIWKRTLVRRSPDKFTISTARRKIRIYSSPPTLAGGTLYHTTNCGIVAALDAATGEVRWVSRYPHREKVHNTEEPVDNLWANRPPLVSGDRVYVTPVDSSLLLCFDARTGKALWTYHCRPFGFPGQPAYLGRPRGLIGMTSDGNLVIQTNFHIHLIEASSGKELWKHVAVSPHRDPPGANVQGGGRPTAANCSNCRPIITEDDWVLMGGIAGWGTLSWNQSTVSLRERKVVAEKWFYSPEYLTDTYQGKKVRDPLVNTEDPFLLVNRMSLRRYGDTFEIECAPGYLAVNYDLDRVRAAVAGKETPAELYAHGELEMAAGRYSKAIELLEKARSGLVLEEARFRAEINQQLYRLCLLYTS